MSAPIFMSWEGMEYAYRTEEGDALGITLRKDAIFTPSWYSGRDLYKMLTTNEDGTPLAKQDVLRVSINPDGTIDIVDFTIPPDGTRIQPNLPQEAVPRWILEDIAMLRITQDGTHVRDLGIKMHDELYYVKRREDVA